MDFPADSLRRQVGALVAALVLSLLPACSGSAASKSATRIRFTDATAPSHLTAANSGNDPLKGAYIHAAAWGDVNGDGRPDLYVGMFTDSVVSYYQKRGATGPAPNRLFLNDGDGTFRLAPSQNATSIMGRTAGAVFVDLNNDGRLDLVVSENNYPAGQTTNPRENEQNHLFRNVGGGRYVDVTSGSGIRPDGAAVGRAVGVLDYNGDHCLDLYLVEDEFHGNKSSSRLLRGDCAFHFTDVTVSAGLASAQGDTVQGLGVGVGDLNGDGWPDLFLAGGPQGKERRNFLFLNRRNGTFQEVSGGTVFNEPACTADPREDWTSGVTLADLNRDGRLDVVLSHHFGSSDFATYGSRACAIGPTLYLNTVGGGGAPKFINVTRGSGAVGIQSKAPHSEVVDLDNDGCPDILVSVRASTADGVEPIVYHCAGLVHGRPTYTTPSYGASSLHYYAGAAVADYDRDGRPDVFMQEFDPAQVPPLYRNVSNAGHWLDVRVSRPRNRFGLGAKVLVYRYGRAGNHSALLAMTQIQTGNGFSSSGEARVHIGLGSTTAVDVKVVLPFGGATRTKSFSAVDRTVTL